MEVWWTSTLSWTAATLMSMRGDTSQGHRTSGTKTPSKINSSPAPSTHPAPDGGSSYSTASSPPREDLTCMPLDLRAESTLITHFVSLSLSCIFRSRFMRSIDRKKNDMAFPKLYYPELYLLEGGYKAFYEQFPVSYLKKQQRRKRQFACMCPLCCILYRICVNPTAM